MVPVQLSLAVPTLLPPFLKKTVIRTAKIAIIWQSKKQITNLILNYLPNKLYLSDVELPMEWKHYFHQRWLILRKPLGLLPSSEQDELENSAYHRGIFSFGHSQCYACGRLQLSTNKTGQIRYMAVQSNWQNQGLGTLVLHSLEQAAHQLKMDSLFLHARENAQLFYSKNGYQLMEEIEPILGIRHFKMSKRLI